MAHNPATDEFAADLLGKMGAEDSELFGSFIDLITQILPQILELFQNCPASRLKRAASGGWVPGKTFGMLRLRMALRAQIGDETFGQRHDGTSDAKLVEDALLELTRESSLERLSGVLREAQS